MKKDTHAHRLFHIHNNVPGMIAQITAVLAEHTCNILELYLKISEKIGDVIIDIDKAYDTIILKILKKIPDTIRFRVLY